MSLAYGLHTCGVGIIEPCVKTISLITEADDNNEKYKDYLNSNSREDRKLKQDFEDSKLKFQEKTEDYLDQLKTAYKERLELAIIDHTENQKKAAELLKALSISKENYDKETQILLAERKAFQMQTEILTAKDGEYADLFGKLKDEFEKKNNELHDVQAQLLQKLKNRDDEIEKLTEENKALHEKIKMATSVRRESIVKFETVSFKKPITESNEEHEKKKKDYTKKIKKSKFDKLNCCWNNCNNSKFSFKFSLH